VSIEVNNESGIQVDESARCLGSFIFEQLYIHPQAELSILLVDEPAMEKLHIELMDEPGATDVLSVPMDELTPGTPDKPTPQGMLGDIAVCPQVAEVQARNAGHPLQDEMLLLTTHGILHLLGYDHAEPEEKAEMFGLQRELLDGIHRQRSAGRDHPVTSLLLVCMALAFLGAAALLTAAEAAFSFLPRHDAEQAVQGSRARRCGGSWSSR
jgi:probable rRNA maturation factor